MTETVYRLPDLGCSYFATAVDDAAALWSKLCAEEVAARGDRGTCVIGAGIGIKYRGPRKRTVEYHNIIDVPMTAGQGSLTWETSVQQVIDFLKMRGIEAFYMPGRMD